MPRRKGVKECACCDTVLGYKQQRYCSEKCARKYKSGKVLYGFGGVGFCFKGFGGGYNSLNSLINQAEKQGHEYVTVRFNS